MWFRSNFLNFSIYSLSLHTSILKHFIFIIVIASFSTILMPASVIASNSSSNNAINVTEPLQAQLSLTPVQNSPYSNAENVTGQQTYQANGDLSLSIETNKIIYLPGTMLSISGTVENETGPITKKVSILVEYGSQHEVVYQTSVISGESGYRDGGLNIEKPGTYYVTVSVSPNIKASTTFEVIEYYVTKAAVLMYLGVASFACLMIVIAKNIQPSLRELLRFILITIIALVPIAVLLSTEVEIGQNSPVGLVEKKIPNTLPTGKQATWNWVINIGGSAIDSYSEGIQIPVFVVVFGLAGGYLRYLYTTFAEQTTTIKSHPQEDESPSSPTTNVKTKEDYETIRLVVLYNSLRDLAFLFLSPLLAIASYFLLLQAGVNTSNLPTIAAVCFAVGLISKQVVERLEEFAGGKLPDKVPSDKTKSKND